MNKKGFTLIETIVAVALLSFAMAGPLTMAIKSISAASVSQEQLTAFYLAQEAIEYVRKVRDDNVLSGNSGEDWLEGLNECMLAEDYWSGCYIDIIQNEIEINACLVSGCPVLNSTNNGYGYSGSNNTIFTRTIKIDNNLNNNNEAKVNVEVKWNGRFGEKIINLQDNIFNWR